MSRSMRNVSAGVLIAIISTFVIFVTTNIFGNYVAKAEYNKDKLVYMSEIHINKVFHEQIDKDLKNIGDDVKLLLKLHIEGKVPCGK